MSKVKAYRGYYVSVGEVVTLLNDLLTDAEKRRTEIVIIGNPEASKLDGAVMSIKALKEALYNLEIFGDLIPQTDPLMREVKPDDQSTGQAPADSVPSSTGDKPV